VDLQFDTRPIGYEPGVFIVAKDEEKHDPALCSSDGVTARIYMHSESWLCSGYFYYVRNDA
jgi:hypothetical protein